MKRMIIAASMLVAVALAVPTDAQDAGSEIEIVPAHELWGEDDLLTVVYQPFEQGVPQSPIVICTPDGCFVVWETLPPWLDCYPPSNTCPMPSPYPLSDGSLVEPFNDVPAVQAWQELVQTLGEMVPARD